MENLSTAGRKRDHIWGEVSSVADEKTKVECNHCGEHVSNKVSRIRTHMSKCSSRPNTGHNLNTIIEEDFTVYDEDDSTQPSSWLEQANTNPSNNGGGRKRDYIWEEVSSVSGEKTKVSCNHCGEHISNRVARVQTHMSKCRRRPKIQHSRTSGDLTEADDSKLFDMDSDGESGESTSRLGNYSSKSIKNETVDRNLCAFVTEQLNGIVKISEFDFILKEIKDKVNHLYFLMINYPLFCKFEGGDNFFSQYSSTVEYLNSNNIREDHVNYYSLLEKSLSERFSINSKDVSLKPEDMDDDEETNMKETEIKQESVIIHLTKHSTGEKKRKKIAKDARYQYECPQCSLKCGTEFGLRRHQFKDHGQTLCPVCGVNFEDFSAYRMHLESHEDSHICEICALPLASKSLLQHHKKTDHGIEQTKPKSKKKSVLCPECGESTRNLHQHLSSKHSQGMVQCPQCEFQTTSQMYIRSHIKVKHESVLKPCPFCGKQSKNLKAHLKASKCDQPDFEKEANRIFACNQCDKSFYSKDNLHKHIKTSHGDPVQCHLCTFQTKFPFNLRMHIKRVHENKPLREVCEVCLKEVTSLDWHMRQVHPNI